MTGIIILDKPENITSFGAVARVRRICGEKKCGHSGTLDPMATGVMTVMLGGATRFCELLPSHDKEYIATFRLGTVTDTLDITGKVLGTHPVFSTKQDVAEALESFVGEISQLPPMYSAISVNGQRLYDLARQGIEVERQSRTVIIYSAEMLEADENANEYKISVACSSGTYIRTLIDDIGKKLGCGAVMTALRRTRANGFSVSDAVTVEKLEEAAQSGKLNGLLIPVEKALDIYPSVQVTEAQAKRFSNGGELDLNRIKCAKMTGYYRVYSPDGNFLGLGEINDPENLQVKRVYVPK
ncbi:MAG: tRNA pseudouridine(55) synthase TruB [Clostridia bacterium]|nr:tRNA pseudouridine(55) synthase TruB [Clostridia bacterium]